MSDSKPVSNTCSYQEAKKAIAKAEDDFSDMLDKGRRDCEKANDSLKKQKAKLLLNRKTAVEKKKSLLDRLKNKQEASIATQLEKVKLHLIQLADDVKKVQLEMAGVRHGLNKIKSLQKQRAMEDKLIAKYRKEQGKKALKQTKGKSCLPF